MSKSNHQKEVSQPATQPKMTPKKVKGRSERMPESLTRSAYLRAFLDYTRVFGLDLRTKDGDTLNQWGLRDMIHSYVRDGAKRIVVKQ